MFKPTYAESELNSQIEDISKKVAEFGGALSLVENWGLKKLAYKIGKFEQAFYQIFTLSIDPLKVNNLTAYLNQKEGIVRNLLTIVND